MIADFSFGKFEQQPSIHEKSIAYGIGTFKPACKTVNNQEYDVKY